MLTLNDCSHDCAGWLLLNRFHAAIDERRRQTEQLEDLERLIDPKLLSEWRNDIQAWESDCEAYYERYKRSPYARQVVGKYGGPGGKMANTYLQRQQKRRSHCN